MSAPDKPWTFDPTNPFIPDHGGEIRDERGKSVCFVDTAQTAERIVNAVNGGTPWQPIETAPRDGTAIILWCPTFYFGEGCWVGWWNGTHFDVCTEGASSHPYSDDGATHWQPLNRKPPVQP